MTSSGYAVASAAGFLFFGLNFGEEAGAATEVWVTRACIVQGLQQIWGEQSWSVELVCTYECSFRLVVLGLHTQWRRPDRIHRPSHNYVHCLAACGHVDGLCIPHVLGSSRVLPPGSSNSSDESMSDSSSMLQIPPYVPNFFKTLLRRKLVIWFLISEILRDYWLSGPYGRNWQFLWAAAAVPRWVIVVEIAVFFVGVWGLFMGLLIRECAISPSLRSA